VDIAFVGKYVDLTESYKSLSESLTHAGIHTQSKVNIHYVDSEAIEHDGCGVLASMDAILVPGGFGIRGTEGKICAIRFAREHKIPYLGICLGMQLAVVEYARNVAGMAGAHSTEFEPETPYPVIGLITEWQDCRRPFRAARRKLRSGRFHAPGRPGVQAGCEGTLARDIYGKAEIIERHRHRFEVNNGLAVPSWKPPASRWPAGRRAPICARWWNCRVRCTPGLSAASSTRNSPPIPAMAIPLFKAFVEAALANQKGRAS
jgi:CTP synthase